MAATPPQGDGPTYLTNEQAELLLLQHSQGYPLPYPVFSSEQSELLHPTDDGAVFFVVDVQPHRKTSWWLNRGRQKSLSTHSSLRKRYRTHKNFPTLKKRIYDFGKHSTTQLHQIVVDTSESEQEEARSVTPSPSSPTGSPYTQVKSWPMKKPSFVFTSVHSVHETSTPTAATTPNVTAMAAHSSSSCSLSSSSSVSGCSSSSLTCSASEVSPTPAAFPPPTTQLLTSQKNLGFFPEDFGMAVTEPQDCVLAEVPSQQYLQTDGCGEPDSKPYPVQDSVRGNSTGLDWIESILLGPKEWAP